MIRLAWLPIVALALVATPSLVQAENWPSWRGPSQNGVAEGKSYPTKWSASENVAWKIDLPGKGSSTPIVWGDRIFLTCGVNESNTVLAFDRQGKERWRTTAGHDRGGKHKKATGCNPSPITDGQHVYAYFKSGDLVCVDLDGKRIWQHNLQADFGDNTLWWDLGTSPVLTTNLVVVAVMQTGPSYLVAYDKETGKQAWKQDRMLDAPLEAAQSYSTPVVVRDRDREILVVLGADHVTAHDAQTGQELWRAGGLNPTRQQYFRSIASAVVSDGLVIAPYARGSSITAFKLGGSGDVTKSHVAWAIEGLGADVPTPAILNGVVYVCTDRGDVAAVDIQTGKKVVASQVERNRNDYSSSPIIAGGHIYITREDGKTFVLSTTDLKVVAENSLDNEFVVATPVFIDGKILIRTLDHLYCIGK